MSQAGCLRVLAHIAQSVEHFLGKEEVTGSNPVMSSSCVFKCVALLRMRRLKKYKLFLILFVNLIITFGGDTRHV